MAKKRRASPVTLPVPGEAFLMPLSDGRFGVCRVIRRSTEEEQKRQGMPGVLVVASPWIGTSVPNLDDPLLSSYLMLTHHAHQGKPEMIWVFTAVPEGFQPLGIIEPLPSELTLECWGSSDWGWMPSQLMLQWRWDHEQEVVAKEDAVFAQEKIDAKAQSVIDYRKHLESLSLETLRGKRRFAGWKGFVPDKALAATRKIFRETIDSVLAIDEPRDPRRVLRILRACIESINRLDDEHGHFIETIAREEICEEFDEVAFASGFRNSPNAADRWRDW